MVPQGSPEATDVVVLCGGQGTRLGALSVNTPKPLLPIGDAPFLLHHLVALRHEGVAQIILAVHYLAERFLEFVEEYADVLPNLTVVKESTPLGTGGALKHAASYVHTPVFIALNGDSWVFQPLAPVLAEHRPIHRSLTMVVVRATQVEGGTNHKGLVSIGPHGEILNCFTEHARCDAWVNAGLYVLNTHMVRRWPSGSYDFDQNLTSLVPPEQGYVFRSEERLLDIGTPECYDLASRVLESSDVFMFNRAIGRKSFLGHSSKPPRSPLSMGENTADLASNRSPRITRTHQMDNAEALQVYRQLLLSRRAAKKIQDEYFNDEIKTPVHLSIGQEAIPIGVCHCLPSGTNTFGTYRNHALYLAMTQDTDGLFAELYGKVTGPGRGKAGSMHLASPHHGLLATSAVVGTTIPLAVGAALANAYRRSSDFVVVFFGDGAVEEGTFWESLNFACHRRLRIVFVCEDNGLAAHIPTTDRQGFRSIPEALQGFECHVMSHDGSDVIEVMTSTRQMLERMTSHPKPGVLHFPYFRFLEHVGPREDFDAGYRRRPTPEEFERLDPLLRFERELCQNGYQVAELEAIQKAVEEQISQSVLAAQAAPFAPPSDLHTDVFA